MSPLFSSMLPPTPTVPPTPPPISWIGGVPDKPVLFAHLYVGLAEMAIGGIGDVLPHPAGQYLVPQVEAPGKAGRS